MLSGFLQRIRAVMRHSVERLNTFVRVATRPGPAVVGLLCDLPRSREQLIAENALLRQQLIVAARTIGRPAFAPSDRTLLVLLARVVPRWRDAVLLVKPETLLRWHREGFRLFWRWKTRHKVAIPKVSSDTIVLIRTMAADNRLWGAERIRGELLKLGIRLAKRTPRTRFAASSRSPHDRERAVARCLR